MLPNKRLWAKWTPTQKVTYLAQLSAPFTLLATVIFAFLSWREAVEAREVQQRFFISQNPPEIDLIDARIEPVNGQPWMWFTFKNVGGSEARTPCVSVHGDLKFPSPESTIQHCQMYEKLTVQRNRSFVFHLPQRLTIGPGAIRLAIWRPGDPPPKCNGEKDVLFLDVSYKDVSGTSRSNYQQILVCRTASIPTQ